MAKRQEERNDTRKWGEVDPKETEENVTWRWRWLRLSMKYSPGKEGSENELWREYPVLYQVTPWAHLGSNGMWCELFQYIATDINLSRLGLFCQSSFIHLVPI